MLSANRPLPPGAGDFDIYLAPYRAGAQRLASHELLGLAAQAYFEDNRLPRPGNHELELGFSSTGKPYFLHLPQLHFSISHSRDWWACALGRAQVGLDIQWQDGRRDIQRLGRRCFHRREVAWLEEKAWQPPAFYDLWAAKEAYVKFSGAGLSRIDSLSRFSLIPPPAKPQLKHLPAPEGYSLCLCAAQTGAIRLLTVRNTDSDPPGR